MPESRPNPAASPTKKSSAGEKSAEKRMLREVASKQQRLESGDRRWNWSSIAVLGVVGWSVTVPTLAGVALGIWIDRHFPSRFSWSLMLLLGGLLFGCVQAWARVKGERVKGDRP